MIPAAALYAEVPLILAQTAQQKPMGLDLSGPAALIASGFGLLVGVCALIAIWRAAKGKPAALFGILGCVLIAGFIYRFTDINKVRDNSLYDGIEQIGGIPAGAPTTPTTR